MPGEPDRGQVQVQPGGIGDGEPAHRGQQQQAAHGLRGRGQRLQRPAQPVIVQQRRRHAQQLGDRRRGRPPGDVIQRRRGAQPARGQHRDHLPVPGQGPAPPRQHPVHDPGHAQGPQVVRHDQQRADMPAGAGRRLVQPGQPGGQLLQLPAGHQLIQPAQVCHNVLAHPAALAPLALAPAPGTHSCARRGGPSSPSDTCCHNTREPGRAAARRHAGHRPADRPQFVTTPRPPAPSATARNRTSQPQQTLNDHDLAASQCGKRA